jgi:hypothetical protein
VGITTGVHSAEISDVGFTVKWNATDAGGSNFKINRYRVDVLKNGIVVKRLEVDGTITQADIDGLEAATTYEVVIYADNGNGNGSSSALLTVTTKEVKPKSDDSNIGLIIGIIIAVLAALIIGIAIGYYCYTRKPCESPEKIGDKGSEKAFKKPNREPEKSSTNKPLVQQQAVAEYSMLGVQPSSKSDEKKSEQITYAKLQLEEGTNKSKSLTSQPQERTVYSTIQHDK